MLFSANDKLLMIGDSITDCERKRPVGEGRNDSYGKGYVSLVHSMLHAWHPELAIRTINMGISGNTVRDLKARWESDVIGLKPDWVSIMIGINDVWRQFDQPLIPETHVREEEYAQTLEELVARTKPHVKGIVLMAPFYIEANPEDPMRKTMDVYGGIVKRIAEEHGTVFIDTQAAWTTVLEHTYPAALAWDRVHPNQTGHMVLARAFLQGTGFTWK